MADTTGLRYLGALTKRLLTSLVFQAEHVPAHEYATLTTKEMNLDPTQHVNGIVNDLHMPCTLLDAHGPLTLLTKCTVMALL